MGTSIVNTQAEYAAALELAFREEADVIVETYVKGRENLCTNPAIAEYNKTSTAANSTVSTLIQIIDKLSEEQVRESKLFKLMEEMGDE